MAQITTGLTNGGVTAHYQFSYDDSMRQTAANPTGPEPARTNAVIAACEGDFNLVSGWFGNINVDYNLPATVQVTTGTNGACWSLGGGNLTVSLGGGGNGIADFLRYLLVAEIVEQFMRAQGLHWFSSGTEGSEGEGLSRFLAAQFLAVNGLGLPPAGFANSNSWLNSSRQNNVNNINRTDDGPDAITGCSLLFIYYLFTQLGFTINQIVAAGANTLGGVYRNLTGDSGDPFPFFKRLLDVNYPGTATIPGPNLDNPFPLSILSFWDDKNTFGKAEVQDAVNIGSNFSNAFWLVLEGYNRQSWQGFGSPMPAALTGQAAAFPGISLTRTGTSFEQPSNNLVPQRIRFAYDVGFNAQSIAGFTTSPQTKELDAAIAVSGNSASAATDLEFLGALDPYFANINPQQNNVPWLSQDLRVLTATPRFNNIRSRAARRSTMTAPPAPGDGCSRC
jgi:hypothetical protein